MELFKAIANSIKDIDTKQRTIVAYASIFGNIDSDDDIIQSGAYAKTIMENGPKGKNRVWHLFNHDWDYPVSKPFEITEDAKGLLFSSKLPDTTFANDLLKLYEAGHLTEHSVWIRIIKANDQVVNEKTIRLISEVALMEVSSVLWGANEQAQTVAVKSIAELNRRIETGNNLMRNGTLTDESFKRLESELSEIKTKLALLTEPPQQQEKPEATNAATLEAIKRINYKLLKLNQSGRRNEKTTPGS
jgi:HK97 family phage prohead protease